MLFMGETGTGKGLFAQVVHESSARRDRPFVQVNCAALPEPLLDIWQRHVLAIDSQAECRPIVHQPHFQHTLLFIDNGTIEAELTILEFKDITAFIGNACHAIDGRDFGIAIYLDAAAIGIGCCNGGDICRQGCQHTEQDKCGFHF